MCIRDRPGTAAWAEARIADIHRVREDTVAIDWPLTLRLARGFPTVRDIRRTFRTSHQRWPNAAETAALHPDRDRSSGELVDAIRWLLRYSAPVALVADGSPFTFASRTTAGRRQQFNLHLDRLFLVAVIEAVTDPSPATTAVRRNFETRHGLDLWPHDTAPLEADVAKAFEDRSLRLAYIDLLMDELGADHAEKRLARAARERVSAMVNAWRNAPIQGGVADIMLAAYGELHQALDACPSARPVQTVHDSVVIECDVREAPRVIELVRRALESASLRFCPDVTPGVDIDVRRSLAEDDLVDDAS